MSNYKINKKTEMIEFDFIMNLLFSISYQIYLPARSHTNHC